INGKEDALQTGFDQGFATTGVPLGRRLGLVRGTSAALNMFAKQRRLYPELVERTDRLEQEFCQLDWRQLAPIDEALEHAKEHLGGSSLSELQSSVDHLKALASLEDKVHELISICRELNVPMIEHLR